MMEDMIKISASNYTVEEAQKMIKGAKTGEIGYIPAKEKDILKGVKEYLKMQKKIIGR